MREPGGFREYVAGSRDRLVRAAWLLTGDLDDAEDLVQATLIKVWPHWQRIVSRDGDVDAYVRRVLGTCYLTALRRRRWRELLGIDSEHRGSAFGDPEDAAVADRDVLARALAGLPPRQRLTVVLRYYLDVSEADTAAWMGCSVGTVKSNAARGLAALATAIQAQEEWRS